MEASTDYPKRRQFSTLNLNDLNLWRTFLWSLKRIELDLDKIVVNYKVYLFIEERLLLNTGMNSSCLVERLFTH